VLRKYVCVYAHPLYISIYIAEVSLCMRLVLACVCVCVCVCVRMRVCVCVCVCVCIDPHARALFHSYV